MDSVFKNDADKILKTFKRSNKDIIKKQCICDYERLIAIYDKFFPSNKKNEIPKELDEAKKLSNCELERIKHNINMQKVFEKNSDLLKDIYEKVLKSFNNYNINVSEIDDLDGIDLGVLNDFFSNYTEINTYFNKIIDTNHLLFYENGDACYTYNLPSINTDYVFLCLDNYLMAMPNMAHEMGHVYQDRITYNDNLNQYNFLLEFISSLMEILFIDYYYDINKKQSEYMSMQNLMNVKNAFHIAKNQIDLLKKYPDAFENFEINSKYLDEFHEMCGFEQGFCQDDLYINFYTIGFLCAINYFYLLKYDIPFDEVEKFYINNNDINNFENILKDIDTDNVNQYLRDFVPKNCKVKKKK